MSIKLDLTAWNKIIEHSPDLVCTFNRHAQLIAINKSCKPLLGYENKEIIGFTPDQLVAEADLPATLQALENAIENPEAVFLNNHWIHKNGQQISLAWSLAWSEKEELIIGVGREAFSEQKSNNKEKLHELLAEHGTDVLALFDINLNFIACGASVYKEIGYEPQALIGKNALEYVHPEDVQKVKESLQRVLVAEGEIIVYDFRFKNVQGEWIWLETRASNQLYNPAVNALVTSSRNISKRMSYKLQLEESEQRFKSLFDHHADMVFFQDKDGHILDVNTAALNFFSKSKEHFSNHKLSHFLGASALPRYTQMLQQALQGQTARAEISLPVADKEIITIDMLNIPVHVDGETIGVYSILRDITAISRSNTTIKQQARKLNTILESITEGFFTVDKHWNFSYVNSGLERIFNIKREDILGKNLWLLIDKSIEQEVRKQYYNASNTGKAAYFEIYLDAYKIWLQTKAFPSEEGLSVFMTDVTESIIAKQELEKLSLVASKTTHGVVITDAKGNIEWVNEGFTQLTGYTAEEVLGKQPESFLLGPDSDKVASQQYKETILQKRSFQAEILNYTKAGNPVWFLLDTTPVLNSAGEIAQFITLQTDISERKETEAKQFELTKDLYRQNIDLQQFTYIVSHNLRSPVANVMGLVDVLSILDRNSSTFDASLEFMKKSIIQLDTVLKDLNMILTIRDKKDAIDKESLLLSVICRQAIEHMRGSLQEVGGEILLDIADELTVRGDKAYLYSVFHNLLSNAIKYRSPKRPLKINVKSFGSSERGTIISFSDNGSGFDMNLAGDKLFKLYKRFHTGSEGRGIGLFLIKTHLNAMGGHIEVTSQVNVGTRFLIYLK